MVVLNAVRSNPGFFPLAAGVFWADERDQEALDVFDFVCQTNDFPPTGAAALLLLAGTATHRLKHASQGLYSD